MTTKTDLPWSDLQPPSVGTIDARRADPQHRFDFYYGVNYNREQLLILKLSGTMDPVPDLPRLKGIRVQWTSDPCSVQLALGKGHDAEMFALLCRDLLAFTAVAQTQVECLDRLCIRLMKWQRLLSKGGLRLLADHEIRGLFAELWFLKNELQPRLGKGCIAAWKGPSGFPQDFAADNKIFEIKSHLVGSPQVVKIASPAQLWVDGADLYLCVYHLAEVSAGGKSLAALIDEIAAFLGAHASATEDFEEKLAGLGYLDLPEYRADSFAIIKQDIVRVTDSFPRIIPSSLPAGVIDVTYAIQLAALAPHVATVPWSEG